jgi:cytoskeletal protein RodZ
VYTAGSQRSGRTLLIVIAVLLLLILFWVVRSRRAIRPKQPSPPLHPQSSVQKKARPNWTRSITFQPIAETV